MPRDLSLSRQEAELITDVLMLTDAYPAEDIDCQIRKQWSMVSRSEELKVIGKRIAEVRMEWARRIIDNGGSELINERIKNK